MIESITLDQLKDRLALVTHAQPIAFSALVDARPRKTGNPFPGAVVLKLSRVSAFTAFDYEASVNRQQLREGAEIGTFESKARNWGTRISPALVEHEGKFYLVAKVERARRPVYLVRDGVSGSLIPVGRQMVEPYLPAPKSAAESQGLGKEVIYRNYGLASLVSLSIGGKTYRIRHGV